MVGYDKITIDMKAPITDVCIFVQFHYVDNKWDPCELSSFKDQPIFEKPSMWLLNYACHMKIY